MRTWVLVVSGVVALCAPVLGHHSYSELYIEADKDLPYYVVVTAMAAAQNAGVTKLQMRTEANAAIDLTEMDRTVVRPASPPPSPAVP